MFHLQRIKILGVHKLPVIIQCLVDHIRRWIMPEHTSSGYQPDPANTGQPIAQGYLQSRPGIGREVFGATVAIEITMPTRNYLQVDNIMVPRRNVAAKQR